MNQFFNADIVVIFLLSFLYFLSRDIVDCQTYTEGCRTPDNRNGDCINIRSCQPLLDLLQRERPPSLGTINFLRQSQCGFEGRTPLVCCPAPEIFSQEESQEESEEEPEPEVPTHTTGGEFPKDVSNHPAVRKLLPEQCGVFTDEKITRGNNASLFEYPWMALLGYYTRGGIQYRCGGSLINKRYVLTAAHCVTQINDLKLTEIRLGEFDLSTDVDCQVDKGCAPAVQDFGIEEVIPHPNYLKAELRNDIALIRLNRDATMTASVQPICLPVGKSHQERTLLGEKVKVTGWGATEYGTNSPILMEVDLPIVPLHKCAAIYEKSVPITEKQLCAGGVDGKDSCSGDSGGPLLFVGQPLSGGLSYIQYGLVSFGPRQCGTRDRPGVYTRIGYYMDWILKTMRS